jgi:hypothetical protein
MHTCTACLTDSVRIVSRTWAQETFCGAEQPFLLLFLEKEESIPSIVSFKERRSSFSWGKAPKPPGSASPIYGPEEPSAEQNNAFCFFFWKKKNIFHQLFPLRKEDHLFLGGKPPNPQGRLRRYMGLRNLLRSRTTLFASFSGKRRIYSINC